MVYDFFEELKEIIREFVKKGINVLKYLSVGIAFILWIIIFFKLNPVTPSSSILTNQEIYVFGRSISNWVTMGLIYNNIVHSLLGNIPI